MDKLYNDLEIKILIIPQEDVIRTSFDGYEDVKNDPFAPEDESTWY